MIVLRDYQQQTIDKLRTALKQGQKRICLQLPTGAGKTIISAFMIKGALDKGLKVLFLVHLKELIEQTAEKLDLFSIDYGLIAAGEPSREAPCQLAMVQTLGRRQNDFKPDLIIVDEMHHACSKTYKDVVARYSNAKLIGLTATPERLDGKGLQDVVDVLVQGPSMRELIDNGYLNEYQYFSMPNDLDLSSVKTLAGDYDQKQLDEAMDQSCIFGDAVSHYKQHLESKKAIVFCVNIKHSKRICNLFNANGIAAAHLDGNLNKPERKQIIEDFRTGKILVLTNCSLISEGFDVPDCDGVIMLRPTQSLGLYLQSVGRGLRVSDSPTVILDHVRNYTRHGMPDDERSWSLEGKKKRVKGQQEQVAYKLCKVCFLMYHPRHRECPNCKAPNESDKKLIEEVEGSLVQIKKNIVQRKDQSVVQKKRQELVTIQKAKGYKPGWVFYKLEEWKKQTYKRG